MVRSRSGRGSVAATLIKRVPLGISRPSGVTCDSAIIWTAVRRIEHGSVEEDSDICALSPEIFGVSRRRGEGILRHASSFVLRIGWDCDRRCARRHCCVGVQIVVGMLRKAEKLGVRKAANNNRLVAD